MSRTFHNRKPKKRKKFVHKVVAYEFYDVSIDVAQPEALESFINWAMKSGLIMETWNVCNDRTFGIRLKMIRVKKWRWEELKYEVLQHFGYNVILARHQPVT